MKPTAKSEPSATPGLRFHHVLVPTDLTERTEKAFHVADKLAVSDGSRITLVHVIETIEGMQFDELKPFYDRLERRARATMTRFARRVPSMRVENALIYGRRAEEIVKFAAVNDVDLIVLASHRVNLSKLNRDWGTISYKVGLLAQCPVLLVK
jgi:universal stress protein A